MQGELYMIGYQGNIHDLPCGALCSGGDDDACTPRSDGAVAFQEVGCFYDTGAMTLATAPVCDGTMNAEVRSLSRPLCWLAVSAAADHDGGVVVVVVVFPCWPSRDAMASSFFRPSLVLCPRFRPRCYFLVLRFIFFFCPALKTDFQYRVLASQVCASFCATVEGATHFGLEYQRE